MFETCRILLVVLVVILRLALMPVYLQAYLNIAYDRVESLRKEAGRITNVEYQKKVIVHCSFIKQFFFLLK